MCGVVLSVKLLVGGPTSLQRVVWVEARRVVEWYPDGCFLARNCKDLFCRVVFLTLKIRTSNWYPG